MFLTFKQTILYLFFLISFLLLVLLGESYLNYFLIGGVSFGLLFFFISGKAYCSKFILNNYVIILLWILFLFFLVFELFFTSSFPLGLNSLAYYSLSFLFFTFILSLRKNFFSAQILLGLLLLIVIVLSAISYIFYLLPNWANLLPGMNLLHATYGHNHLAALLLLLLPSSWWLAFEEYKKGHNQIWFILPLFFVITLISSFGRTSVILGLLQFLFLWKNQSIKSSFQNNLEKMKVKRLRTYFRIVLVLFILTFLIKLFFSSISLVKKNYKCPVPALEEQLCKNIMFEARPHYWQSALKIIRDKPWLGSGPGTFQLESKKYHLNNITMSAYVHNSYLQALSELGLIGGSLFIFLMVFMLYKAYKIQKESEPGSWQRAIFLGLAAIYINAFFDFDWHFISVFSLTLVLLALLLREGVIRKKIKNKNIEIIIKTSFIAVSLYLISVAFLYVGTEYLIRSNKVSSAFNFFPYIHWQRKIYEQKSLLSNQQRHRLLSIYHAHPSVYQSFINSTDDPKIQQQLKEAWVQLEPRQLFYQDLTSYYLKREEPENAAKFLLKTYNLIKTFEISSKEEFEHKKKVALGQEMLELADLFYQKKEPKLAVWWYNKSRFVDDWQLAKHKPIFLSQHNLSFAKQLIFFDSITEKIPVKFFGQYRADYAKYYQEILISQLKTGDQAILDSLDKHLAKIIHLDSSQRQALWEAIATELLTQARLDLTKQQLESGYQKLTKLAEVRDILSDNNKEPLEWTLREQLGRELILIGDKFANQNLKKTLIAYDEARLSVEWIIYVEPHWLKKVNIEQLSIPVLEDYFNYLASLSAEKFAWLTDERTQVAMTLIKKLVENDNLSQALIITNKTQEINNLDYKQKRELVAWLQVKALELFENENFNSAKNITEIMTQLMPDDYWIAPQKANLFLAQKDYDQAEKEYQACLDGFKPKNDFEHQECVVGLQKLKNQSPDHNRYLEVAQIIIEENTF